MQSRSTVHRAAVGWLLDGGLLGITVITSMSGGLRRGASYAAIQGAITLPTCLVSGSGMAEGRVFAFWVSLPLEIFFRFLTFLGLLGVGRSTASCPIAVHAGRRTLPSPGPEDALDGCSLPPAPNRTLRPRVAAAVQSTSLGSWSSSKEKVPSSTACLRDKYHQPLGRRIIPCLLPYRGTTTVTGSSPELVPFEAASLSAGLGKDPQASRFKQAWAVLGLPPV